MVHYIRFLRTPQTTASKKTIDISAVVAVTTDLGDSLYPADVNLVAEVAEANHPYEILCTNSLEWKATSRALKFNIQCPGKYISRPILVHVTTQETSDALKASSVPKILDVWSVEFPLSDKQRAEPVVERQLWLSNRSRIRIREETGDSIARHIWDASLGFLVYFDKTTRSSPPVGTASMSILMKANQVRRLKVLELGAGCGIVGVAFAQLVKCDMLLTDLEDAQEILGRNVRLATPTAGSSVQAQNLDWETGLDDSSNSKFDLILVSDCIYNPESSLHLVKTLRQLALRAPNVVVLVGFKRRHDADSIFFERMQSTKFEIVESINIPLPHTNTDQDPEPPTTEFYTYRLSEGAL
ncbi:uncharacterized protein A1O9_10201 [Exophiala aquamarina CBS 119918]|uniref:Methyltransferase-domain-containing protein n=1 Tax=Exophiala aquamarina CBS 119918 TaxID=1182545 RepID=A0A072PE42_9EURO|nr:uncharacterized protein A1O9_10201 [Exophiala aquamarina CBS 119918]KEF53800.1 hypothetical protein A1O9_10201 [Exophiala aquamarina CBS 119918]